MNKTLSWIFSWVAAMCLLIAIAAQAQPQPPSRGSREEAVALVEAAYKHIQKVGAEAAYKDFTQDTARWNKKDLYVMVYDNKGYSLANGVYKKLVGKDMSGLKDANGVAVVTGMIALAAKGGGWFDYDWPDPLTKKIMAKSTYTRSLPNGDGFIGVGVYK